MDKNFHLHDKSCYPNCRYDCIQNITKVRILQGLPILKYYGHWPFKNYFGLEEPASTLFSLFNILPHFYFLFYQRSIVKHYFMYHWLVIYSIISVNTWIASTLYHSHKNSFSTKYDLSSALLFLCFNLWLTLRRILSNYFPSIIANSLLCLLVAVVIARIYLINIDQVSFSDHMNFCIIISLIQIIAAVLWSFYILLFNHSIPSANNKKAYFFILFHVLFIFAALLEVYDFPPICYGLFDAHALWHLATVPLCFMWYQFWIIDSVNK
jgi:hypothetical protein